MNKDQLVEAIAERVGVPKKVAKGMVDAFWEIVRETLEKGEEVKIVGWGTFQLVERKERKVRNPRTGEEMLIPGSKVAKFRPGSKLKGF